MIYKLIYESKQLAVGIYLWNNSPQDKWYLFVWTDMHIYNHLAKIQ